MNTTARNLPALRNRQRPAKALKILLVDDNRDFVASLRQCLDQLPGATEVEHAHDGPSALMAADRFQPDLVLMDIAMPDMNGLEIARRMADWARPPRMVFLSVHDNQAYRSAAAELGAAGFVSKADFVAELLPEIERMVQAMNERESLASLGRTATPGAAAGQLAQQAMDLVSDGVLMLGPDRAIVSVNRAFERMTGFPREFLRGRTCALLRGALTSGDTVKQLRAALDAAQVFAGELLVYRKDGTAFWSQLSIHPAFEGNGPAVHFLVVVRDISADKANALHHKLTSQVFAQSREAILVADAQANIIMANKAFTDISGYTQAEVLGKNPRELSAQREKASFYDVIAMAVATDGIWEGEVRNWRKDGTDYAEWLVVSGVRDAEGAICNYIATFSDITEQKAASERIQRLSHFDALTGLPNRSLLAERCAQDLAQARRDGKSVAMLVFGLDHFKLINETLGRTQGDAVLQQFAGRLRDAVQERDTVARISGDEFVLLAPDFSAECTAHLAEKLQQLAAKPYQAGAGALTITTSIGVAMYPSDGQDFETLFEAADTAMHQAKQSGRGKYRFFSAGMHREAMEQVALVTALRSAIPLGQLQLHYQPFVDLQSGCMAGMEALLRWNHPELGSVSPARFIPIAERSGLIVEIGAWVLRQACSDLRDWLDRGVQAPPVSVNISPVQFRDPALLRHVESTLREFSVDPGMLCIEVTEGALMDDVEHSKTVLRALRNLGLRLSLDDFGTGYSSLNYLKLFPFDKVKIDQSFVRGLSDNPQDAVIVKVVIAMAHGLGLGVIAEGVETEFQCEFMRNHQCDLIQGYLFSKPVPRDAMDQLLSSDRRLPAHLLRAPADDLPAQRELVQENQLLSQKIRGANRELAQSHRMLDEVLDDKQRNILHTENTLAVLRDALQSVPAPILGLDDEGQIAFVNDQAQRLFEGTDAVLGADIAGTLPSLHALVDKTPENDSGSFSLNGRGYQVRWRRMGGQSSSRGRIITLHADVLNQH